MISGALRPNACVIYLSALPLEPESSCGLLPNVDRLGKTQKRKGLGRPPDDLEIRETPYAHPSEDLSPQYFSRLVIPPPSAVWIREVPWIAELVVVVAAVYNMEILSGSCTLPLVVDLIYSTSFPSRSMNVRTLNNSEHRTAATRLELECEAGIMINSRDAS